MHAAPASPLPIEAYALIGDCFTAALVGRDGSIDWLSFPRFDSPACFAALLGGVENGRWLLAPARGGLGRRRYRPGTLVLETEFETDDGAVRITDFMPYGNDRCDVVRIVEGVRGSVPMHLELAIRFDYGRTLPWIRRPDHSVLATAGPDALELHSSIDVHVEHHTVVADFTVSTGERVPFVLNYRPSHLEPEPAIDAEAALAQTTRYWEDWSRRSSYEGRWEDAVTRSLLTLKALIYEPTGGIVAAPTTSLPEHPAGVRNWDYRYCWLRDATYTLNALLLAGYHEEAVAWREWLLRAAGGNPADLQMLYSVTGERRLDENVLPWLAGYGGAAPVRVGNAATTQFQLDVYGEVIDSLYLARAAGLEPGPHSWEFERAVLDFLERHWQEPDEGIWEVRGPRRHFTHSKVMAWVAFDRAVKSVELYGLDGPVDRWREVRDAIKAEVCERGYDRTLGSFVQHYETTDLDASLLLIPLVGFLPAEDPRVIGTIAAIERDLVSNGLVRRYHTHSGVDDLPPGEGAFLACSFWLADALALTGRQPEAEALFERLLALCNDVGLLSEEYDPSARLHLGNFPQALSHMALVNTASVLSRPGRKSQRPTHPGDRPSAAA